MSVQSTPVRRDIRPYVGVGVGVFTASTAAILIRLAQGAGAHSLVIAAWRLSFATLILTPIAWFKCRDDLRTLTRREVAALLVSGVFLAIHFASWITSLAYTSVAASVVLVSTYPIFVGLVSQWVFRERPSRQMVAAMVVTLAGSTVIGLGDWGKGTHRLWGDLLALIGAGAGAGYFLIGRRLRARLPLLVYVFPVYGTAAVTLMVWTLLSVFPPTPQNPQAWVWIFLMTLGPQLLGHSSLNWALRYLSATYVTLATLMEPIGSALLAWLVLGETPSVWAVVGGGVTLAGVAVASWAEQRAADAAV